MARHLFRNEWNEYDAYAHPSTRNLKHDFNNRVRRGNNTWNGSKEFRALKGERNIFFFKKKMGNMWVLKATKKKVREYKGITHQKEERERVKKKTQKK